MLRTLIFFAAGILAPAIGCPSHTEERRLRPIALPSEQATKPPRDAPVHVDLVSTGSAPVKQFFDNVGPRYAQLDVDVQKKQKLLYDKGVEFTKSWLETAYRVQAEPNLYSINALEKILGQPVSCLDDEAEPPFLPTGEGKQAIRSVACHAPQVARSPQPPIGAVIYRFHNATPFDLGQEEPRNISHDVQAVFSFVSLKPYLRFEFRVDARWRSACPTIPQVQPSMNSGWRYESFPPGPTLDRTLRHESVVGLLEVNNRTGLLVLGDHFVDGLAYCSMTLRVVYEP